RRESGSAPTGVNGTEVPSPNEAVPDCAFPTTCALVSRKPSLVNTTAEPRLSPPRREPRWGTRRLATLPVSSAATPTTIWEYASSGDCMATSAPLLRFHHYARPSRPGVCFPRALPHCSSCLSLSPAPGPLLARPAPGSARSWLGPLLARPAPGSARSWLSVVLAQLTLAQPAPR